METKSAKNWHKEGFNWSKRKEYQKAIECYDKAIALKPDNVADICCNKGNALYYLGNYQEAIKCYDKTIELEPDNADAYYNKGLAFGNLGNYNESIECYDKAILLKPDHTKYRQRGDKKFDRGDKKGAIEDYTKAIEINCIDNLVTLRDKDYWQEFTKTLGLLEHNNSDTYYWRGVAKMELQDYSGAIDDYSKAIDSGIGVSASRYSFRGGAKLRINDIEGAIQDYLKAIEIDVMFYPSYERLLRIHYDRKEYTQVIKYLDEIVKMFGEDFLELETKHGFSEKEWNEILLNRQALEKEKRQNSNT